MRDNRLSTEAMGPFFLEAAQGYYELGMWRECEESLAQLPPALRLQPEALELAVLVLIQEKRWSRAIEQCRFGIEHHPEHPFGYLNLAFAFHEMGQTQRALALLEETHHIVGVEPVALYNRGCYLVRLERLPEGVFWLLKAFRADESLRVWAVDDPDLDAVRAHLGLERNDGACVSGDD